MVEGNHHLVIVEENGIDESVNQHFPVGFLPHVQLAEAMEPEKSIQKQMEVLMLKKENEQLRRFVNSIPPEIRQALKEQQRGQRHPKDYQR